jgi:hypothetical protein
LVSHKPEHKLGGALHKDTNYGRKQGESPVGKPIIHQRIDISSTLKPSDISCIVDKNVRQAVIDFETTIGEFKKWSLEKHGYPFIVSKDGRQIPIKRVRIAWEGKNAVAIGSVGVLSPLRLDNKRYVDSSAKHHVAVFVSRAQSGKTKKLTERWVSSCVSVLEAHHRHRGGQPVVKKMYDKDAEADFLFSLQKSDIVELGPDNNRDYYLLTSIEADGRINFVPINAAGKREDQGNVRVREMANGLRPLNLKKVFIDLLGVPHYVQESDQ